MDIPIKKKPALLRYKYYILAGILFVLFLMYVIVSASGGRKLRIDSEKVEIAAVKQGKFLDYVDAEGVVQPIVTVKLNTLESGTVERVLAEEGVMLRKGDAVLLLSNPELMRTIAEQMDEWEKQRILFREKMIEMKQKNLILQQQSLQATYELKRLQKDYSLSEEEYKMGVKSKAQLDVQREEYAFKKKSTTLQLQGLWNDSAASVLRQNLMNNDLELARKKNLQTRARLNDLVVKAPIDGQLSFLNVALGQRVGPSENVGEIKVMANFKIHTQLSEYYIDRITVGLPASASYLGKKYPLRVSKIVPEVKDRQFNVDLVFVGEKPNNVRIGKSFRVQIELGQPETAVIIPRGDFFQATAGQWIYKLNKAGDKAMRTPITVGRQNPVQYEITQGLKPGDRVVVSGYADFGEVEELIIK